MSALVTLATDNDQGLASKWDYIKTTFYKTAKYVIGFRQKRIKEMLTLGTWEKIDKWKQLKVKLLSTIATSLQKLLQEAN